MRDPCSFLRESIEGMDSSRFDGGHCGMWKPSAYCYLSKPPEFNAGWQQINGIILSDTQIAGGGQSLNSP
jgi:hypothetical protein